MENTEGKQKGKALVEVVSRGSPRNFSATEGRSNRVSPLAKNRRELRSNQLDVTKSLTMQPLYTWTYLQTFIKAAAEDAVEAAMQKEKKKNLIFEDVKNNLVTDTTLRSLVLEWSKTSFGKETLQRMTEAVNRKHDERAKTKELPYAHKVSQHNLFSDLKQLMRRAATDDVAKKLLDTARVAIEASSDLPGQEFLELVSRYVEPNELAHITWTPEKLQHVLDLTKEDRLQVSGHTPALWIQDMVHTIAKVRGWVLEKV